MDSASGDVDIFLTCEWPAGVTAALPAALQPQSVTPSAGAAALCVLNTCKKSGTRMGVSERLGGGSPSMGQHDSCVFDALQTA